MKKIKNPKQKNKRSYSFVDQILLDPKKYQKLNKIIALIILVILAGFVLLQIFSTPGAVYYWPIMGILIALTVAIIICSFVFAFLKGSRFQKFNKQNFQLELINNYVKNDDVKEFKIIDDKDYEAIPAENLVCSKIPKTFKFLSKSNEFKLIFKDSPNIIEYVLVFYKSLYKTALATLEGNFKKVLIIKLKSINEKSFYIANQTLNFTDHNYLEVNFQKLVLKGKTENYYVFLNENEEFDIKEMLDLKVLDKFLFNPNHLLQAYDLYNDKNNAYLITTVPAMFMNSNLEPNESINNFQENLKRQAANDLIILKLLSNLKQIIEEDLVKDVNNLQSKQDSSFNKINNPELKIKESSIASDK